MLPGVTNETRNEVRHIVAEVVEILKVLYKADLPEGGAPTLFTEIYIEAVGELWDPRDVRGAARVILRERRDRNFPLPPEIRDAIIEAKRQREDAEAFARFKLAVEYHDHDTQRVFYIQTGSEAERDALKAEIFATEDHAIRRRIATSALRKAGQKTPEDYENGYRNPVKPSWTS